MIERTIEINAPIETFFEVVCDVEKYPKFLSTASEVVRTGSESNFEAEFRINVIKTISYTLAFTAQKPHELRWSLVKGELMKRNDGAWRLEAMSPQKTKAVYQIDIEFGWLVPKSVVQMLTETQLPDLLSSFQKRAEAIYASEGKRV